MKCDKKFINLAKKAFDNFTEIEAPTRASALAYATLLSLIPIIILCLGLFSALPWFRPYVAISHKFLFSHLVPKSASSLQHYISSFAQHSTNISVFSMIIILVMSIFLIFIVESTFNKIWKVKIRRKGLMAFLIYSGFLILLPPIVVAGFASTAFLFSLPYISEIVNSIYNFWSFFYLVPVTLLFLMLLIVYKALPNCKVKLGQAALGAAVAAPLLELMKVSFGVYITHFSSYKIIFGAAAVVPIFLLWLYMWWLIVIIGAIIASLEHQTPC